MSLENGMVGLILTLLGMLGNFIFNLFGEEIENKKLVKKRVKQSLITGSIYTIVWALLIAYFNRYKAEILPDEENIFLLYTFISTTMFFYLVKGIHHLIYQLICVKSRSKKNNKIRTKESGIYLTNILTSISIAIILVLVVSIANLIIINPKSVTMEDSTIRIQKIEYILPKNTPFQFNYVLKNPGGKKNALYEYEYNNTEYVLKKGTWIKLFPNSELHKKEPNSIVFINNKQYADAKIIANENSVLQLNKGEVASLESDVRIKINYTDSNTINTILNFQMFALLLLLYYVLKSIDWGHLIKQLNIILKKNMILKSK